MAVNLKQPSEHRDYDIGIESDTGDLFVGSVPTISIQAVPTSDEPVPTLEVGPGALPDYQFSPGSDIVKVWIGGGTDGIKYKVTVRDLNTQAGRKLEADILIKVKER
jgi:hypothetical protein